MTLDGQRQRRALTAAEQAIQALAAGHGERAAAAAARAAELDQIGVFAGLPEAVAAAVGELTGGDSVSAASWDGLAAAVGPGPLAAAVAEARSGAAGA